MRRLFWASTGYALGLGSSLWVQRRVRRTVERYTPEQLRQQVADHSRELADRARQTVIDLRDAANEGRVAMRESENELRDEFAGRPQPRHHGSARAKGDAPPASAPVRPRSR